MRHHPYGPSSIYRRSQCPGSVDEEAGLPDAVGPAAEEGTRLHELVSGLLRTGVMPVVEPEDRRLLELCLGRVEGIRKSYGDGYREHIEETLEGDVPVEGFPNLVCGTPDYVIVNDRRKRATVVNFKFGHRKMREHVATPQADAEGFLVEENYDASDVDVIFYNPRLNEEITWTYRRVDAIETWRLAMVKEKRLTAGDHCEFCRALGLCSATQGRIATFASQFPEEKKALALAVERMPLDRLQLVADMLPLVSKAVDLIRDRIRATLNETPGAISGWKLKERQSPLRLSGKALVEAGCSPMALLEGKTFSPAEALAAAEASLVDRETIEAWMKLQPRSTVQELRSDR